MSRLGGCLDRLPDGAGWQWHGSVIPEDCIHEYRSARMNRIVDRSNVLIAIPDDDTTRAPLKAILPHLKWRAKLLNKVIEYAVTGYYS
jgi:hypothetical protein